VHSHYLKHAGDSKRLLEITGIEGCQYQISQQNQLRGQFQLEIARDWGFKMANIPFW